MNPIERNTFSRVVLTLILGCGWFVPALSQDIRGLPSPKDPCVGQLEKQHPQTPYDFTTNSQRPTDGFTFQHCVHNNKSSVVDIRWLVPELNATIAGNESRLSPRYSVKPPLGNRDGCLIYGNLLDKDLKAEFWARVEDEEAVQREKTIGNCMAAFKAPPTPPKKEKGENTGLKELLAPFRVFLSADSKSPETSLVAFEGAVGVRVRSANSYESFLQYRVRPTEGSNAKALIGFTISPVWRGSVEGLSKFYNAAAENKSIMAVVSSDKPTEIRFAVEGTDAWSFGELEYELRDGPRVVASVYVPAFIPAR